MTPAQALVALTKLGIPADRLDDALAILEAMQAECLAPYEARKKSDAERKRRSRDSHVTSADSHVTVTPEPSPLVPPLEVSPTPPSKTPPIIPPSVELCNAREPLETQMRKAAGWESHPAPNLFVTGPIEELLRNGCLLEADVLPILKRDAPRCRSPNWKFFVPAIVQARDDRLNAAKVVSLPPNASMPHHGTNQQIPPVSARQAHLAKLKQRAVEARLAEIGEGGDSS